jgi:uncharacterized MAPEG superfamily protein
MTIPELSLLGFAVWTIVVPLGAIGAYRLSRVVRGTASMNAFRSDAVTGADWYRRAMRAHANCVENLPVFCTIIVLATILGVKSRHQDVLAATVLGARVVQSTVHMGWVETARAVTVRFTAFFIQVMCMLALAIDLWVAS